MTFKVGDTVEIIIPVHYWKGKQGIVKEIYSMDTNQLVITIDNSTNYFYRSSVRKVLPKLVLLKQLNYLYV